MKENTLDPQNLELGQKVRLIKEFYERMLGTPHPHGIFFKPGLSGEIVKLHHGTYKMNLDNLSKPMKEAALCTVRLRITDYMDYQVTLQRSEINTYFAPISSLQTI